MHTVVIGIWGDHMMRSIVYLYKTTLQRSDFPRGGKGNHFIANKGIERIFRKMATRLTHFTSEVAGFTLTPKYAKHMYNVSVKGKGNFTAGRVEFLMVCLPFVLRDIAFHEVKKINSKIDAARPGTLWHGLAKVVDPWADAARACIAFLEFFTLARSYETCEIVLPELAGRIENLQKTLLDVFPGKSGETIINIIDMFMMIHMIICIMELYFIFTTHFRLQASIQHGISQSSTT